LSSEVLLVNDYTGAQFARYRRRLWSTLKNAGLNAEIAPFPWFSTDEMNDDVWSATGCYINFIHTACGIVLPTFEHQLDEKAVTLLRQRLHIPIRQIPALQLARLGGVFNCVCLPW
jgi:agmatine/peptidylarginine deiminase